MVLTMKLLQREMGVTEVLLCVDSQAAILAAAGNNSRPGHHILDKFHCQQWALSKLHNNMAILIRWTPGHCDIVGNEAADKAAQKATEGDTTPINQLPKSLRERMPYSKTALRQAFHTKLKEMAADLWKRSPRYQRTNDIVPELPRASYFKSIACLPRKHTSIITQIITGHAPLNKHLHHINKVDTPTCPACHEHDETITHFVLHCQAHRAARRLLMDEIPDEEQNLKGLLATHKNRKHLLNFVARTTRFRSVYGKIMELPDQE